MKLRITIDQAEHATILAALRYYQHQGMGHYANRPLWLEEIACPDKGERASLDDEGIDFLSERIKLDYEEVPDYSNSPPITTLDGITTDDLGPRQKCANCGRQRSDHWGPAHGAKLMGCSGFVPSGKLVGAP